MSKFFRRNPDSDSSSSASDSEDLNEDEPSQDQDYFGLSESRELIASPPAEQEPSNSIAAAGPNKDLLLHALLEEKCINDVRKEHAGRSTSEAAIIIEARNRYQALSTQLVHGGLTAPGLDEDAYQAIRQQYRDGLDVVSKAAARPESSSARIRPTQRRMLTGVDHDPSSLPSIENLQISPAANIPLTLGPYAAQPPMFGTRYTQDFEELGVLGKGGYGIVYSCKHKLDGVIYAVKKVPVSETRRQQIIIRGQAEVDELLSELRTLAQLDHPNIVRYYNGWLDYINLDAPSARPDAGFSDTGAGAEDTRTDSLPPGRVLTESEDGHILFENSTSGKTSTSTASNPSTTSANSLHRTTSHATRATVSDEDVESISRPSSSGLITGTDNPQFTSSTPQLAVHMQMALYPMTLTDFLSPSPPTQPNPPSSIPPLRHCFHLKPSLHILLAILDGIAYLHAQQIVHRDLKPGNIFLSPDPNATNASNATALCASCSPVALRVRIGDFGLVTALAKGGEEEASYKQSCAAAAPVGTELYRPSDEGIHERGNASPALDVFAAGVVAFELLWPFGTRMERHATLNGVKNGVFPADFGEKVGDADGRVEGCLRDMLRAEHPSVEELRRRVGEML